MASDRKCHPRRSSTCIRQAESSSVPSQRSISLAHGPGQLNRVCHDGPVPPMHGMQQNARFCTLSRGVFASKIRRDAHAEAQGTQRRKIHNGFISRRILTLRVIGGSLSCFPLRAPRLCVSISAVIEAKPDGAARGLSCRPRNRSERLPGTHLTNTVPRPTKMLGLFYPHKQEFRRHG